jgi:hypothetical protein
MARLSGSELKTLVNELNGGATIGDTLLFQLLHVAKAIVEQRRPWMILRKTDTSQTGATANTWQTAIDLSTISDFNRFYETEDSPAIRLFDGSNRIEYYRQVPFDNRLEHFQTPNTFVYNKANKTLYLNG